MRQFSCLKHDLDRYFYHENGEIEFSLLEKLKTIFFTLSIWAIIEYRVRRYFKHECGIQLIKRVCAPFFLITFLIIQIITKISINGSIDIGPGLYIENHGNIFLGGPTKMGKMCSISHECLVGWAGRGENRGLPELGDFVCLSPGVKIFGDIKIENGVEIYPNSVVTKSMPANSIVAGIPAKIQSITRSKSINE